MTGGDGDRRGGVVGKVIAGATAGKNYRGDCPHCGEWVSKRGTDRYTKCHRCGWKAGLPILRLLTHWPNVYRWKRWFRRWTRRATYLLAFGLFLGFVLGTTVGTGIAIIDTTAEGVASSLGVSGAMDNFSDAVADLQPSDVDNDRLQDDAENDGQTHSTTLPEADSEHKDLYIVVVYSDSISPLTQSEKRSLRRIWAGMNVFNPDNESGIDLHIIEEQRADETITLSAEASQTERGDQMAKWYQEYVSEGCGVYHMVILGTVEGENISGWGSSPGYSVFVEGSDTQSYDGSYTDRVRTITHELLHNVVGDIEGEHVEGEPGHSETGWLSHVERAENLNENQHLAPPVAHQLSDRGFRDSTYYQTEVC